MENGDICMLILVVFLLIVSIRYLMDDNFEGQDETVAVLPPPPSVEGQDLQPEGEEVEEEPVDVDPVEMEQPPMEEPPMEETPMEEPPMEQPPMEEPPVEELSMEQPPMEQPPMEQPPMEQPTQQGPYGLSGSLMGYEDSSMFASVDAPYGDVVPVSMQQEYALLKSLGKIMPGDVVQLKGYGQEQDAMMPAFDPTAQGGLLPEQQFGAEGEQAPPQSGDRNIEVHMVYAEWCGHSQNAKPAFQELVESGISSTNQGVPVKFVMTEEEDESFKMFEGKIQGFPTFMVVNKSGNEVESMEELNVSDRSAEAIRAAAQALV